jgi:hypothetical protein
MAGSRANWENMSTEVQKKEEAIRSAKEKAKKAPLGEGLVNKAKGTILDYQERQRKAMEEAGI